MENPAAVTPTGPLQTEPVRIAGLVTNFLYALFAVLVALNVNMSDTLQTALLASIIPTIGFIQGMFEIARTYVTPVAKADVVIEKAYQITPNADESNKPTLTNP